MQNTENKKIKKKTSKLESGFEKIESCSAVGSTRMPPPHEGITFHKESHLLSYAVSVGGRGRRPPPELFSVSAVVLPIDLFIFYFFVSAQSVPPRDPAAAVAAFPTVMCLPRRSADRFFLYTSPYPAPTYLHDASRGAAICVACSLLLRCQLLQLVPRVGLSDRRAGRSATHRCGRNRRGGSTNINTYLICYFFWFEIFTVSRSGCFMISLSLSLSSLSLRRKTALSSKMSVLMCIYFQKWNDSHAQTLAEFQRIVSTL